MPLFICFVAMYDRQKPGCDLNFKQNPGKTTQIRLGYVDAKLHGNF